MQSLCDCHLPSLWRFVYTRVGGDAHLAEDITSETVLAMLTAIASDPDGVEIINLGGWLRTVAGRRVSDHFRAVSRVQHLLEQVASNPRSEAADPAGQKELEETRCEVRRAMDKLPAEYRLALEWKYLDNLSVREIALRWETTEKSAESILFRARREFRERMTRGPSPELARNGQHVPLEEQPANGNAAHQP
jgi:RNA polymerase sigma factor (sigma-70 family)